MGRMMTIAVPVHVIAMTTTTITAAADGSGALNINDHKPRLLTVNSALIA
jgi:hypothetical protein